MGNARPEPSLRLSGGRGPHRGDEPPGPRAAAPRAMQLGRHGGRPRSRRRLRRLDSRREGSGRVSGPSLSGGKTSQQRAGASYCRISTNGSELAGMRSQVVASLSEKRQLPPRPVSSSPSGSSRQVDSSIPATDESQPGLTMILKISPPAEVFDSVSLQSGFSNSLNKVHSPNNCSGVTVAALMAAWVRMKNSPSPLRSASYMCDSTSIKSRTMAPLEFNNRTASLGPIVQTTTSLSDGKAVPQPSSRSSLKPPVAGSSLKVTGQVLSRAAFEISHAPTISLAASLGACAATLTAESASAMTAREARAHMGNPNTLLVLGTLSPGARLVMPCRRGG